VKLQALNLGSKLALSNPDQTMKIFTYLLTLAKFDVNYDVRDRGRLLRRLLINSAPESILGQHTQSLVMTSKPAPVIPSSVGQDADGAFFIAGTISSLVKHTIPGYSPLPSWGEADSDPVLRNPPRTEYTDVSYGLRGFGSANSTMPGFGSDSFSGSNGSPAFSRPAQTAFSPATMGYSSRADFEKAFWGDGSDDERSRSRSRSTSRSRSRSRGRSNSRSRSRSRSRSWSRSRSRSPTPERPRSRSPSPAHEEF
jgi:AP-3 complex subunit beta